MSKMGSCDFSEFEKWQKQIEKMSKPREIEKLMRKCIQEVAMETLRRTIEKTPVSDTIKIQVEQMDDFGNKVRYKSGKNKGKVKMKTEVIHTGGTLRRGWIATTQAEAEANKNEKPDDTKIRNYVYRLRVHKKGDTYQVWLVNPVEYASYVELGHRQMPGRYVPAIGKRLKSSFVEGKKMLDKSMKEVNAKMDIVIDEILQDYFDKMFEG